MKDLNHRQQLFCQEYLKDFNATQAAIRAGYSEKSAYSQAHDLLKKPEIAQMVRSLSDQSFSMIGLSRQRILHELALIAFSSEVKTSDKLKALDSLLQSTSANEEKHTNCLRDSAERILGIFQRMNDARM